MKTKTLISGLFGVAVTLSLASCADDLGSGRKGVGMLSPSVGVDGSLLTADVAPRSESNPTASDLSMTITAADGSFSKTWSSVDDFDDSQEFAIGNYTVEVAYADSKAEGFDITPAYYGCQDVKVTEGTTTPVNVTATRTQAMVNIDYTDAFKNFIKSAKTSVVSASGNAFAFSYSAASAETRAAYIIPGKASIRIDIVKNNGVAGTNLLAAEFTAEARHFYHVTIDVNEGGVGGAVLKVTFDDQVESESIDVDLSDESLIAPAPEFTFDGLTNGQQIDMIESAYSGDKVQLNIIARAGIQSVKLKSKSTYLQYVCHWPEEIELVNAPQATIDMLTANGIDSRGLWAKPGAMALIDFTNVIDKITYFNNDDKANVSSFAVTVVDKNGKTTEEEISFTVKVDEAEISIINDATLGFLETSGDITIKFNGANPAKNIKFFYRNTFTGIDMPLEVTSVKAGVDGQYTISLAGFPSDEKPVAVIARCGNKEANTTLRRKPGPFSIATSNGENGIFATKAYINLDVEGFSADKFASLVSFWDLTDETPVKLEAEYVATANAFAISGLNPDTEYTIAASLTDNADEHCATITFTTEASAQLPNSGLEEWGERVDGATNYWWIEFPALGWSSLNQLTTSEGGSTTSGNDRDGCSYNAYSGTRETTDTHSGDKAAIIQTVGWGKGNKSTTSIFSAMGTCNHVTPGELYLGSYNEDNKAGDYGYAFTSRPTSLKFFYKYTAKASSDYGLATVKILDAEGNEIASGDMQLRAKSAYTEAVIDLTYEANAAKAAQIVVVFKSSGNSGCWTANTTNLSCPARNNTTDGRYTGSSLYIDDIELIY